MQSRTTMVRVASKRADEGQGKRYETEGVRVAELRASTDRAKFQVPRVPLALLPVEIKYCWGHEHPAASDAPLLPAEYHKLEFLVNWTHRCVRVRARVPARFGGFVSRGTLDTFETRTPRLVSSVSFVSSVTREGFE